MDALPSPIGDRADEIVGVRVQRCTHCDAPILQECRDCLPELLALRHDRRPLRVLLPVILAYGPTTRRRVARLTGRSNLTAQRVIREAVEAGEAHWVEAVTWTIAGGAA